MFVCEFIYTEEQNLSSKLVFKPSSECILSLLIPVSLVSRSDENQSYLQK